MDKEKKVVDKPIISKKTGKPKRKPSAWNEFFAEKYETAKGETPKEKMTYVAKLWKKDKQQKQQTEKPTKKKEIKVEAKSSKKQIKDSDDDED